MNRKLSDAERVVWLVDQAASLNAAAVARINGPLDEKVLRIALNWLQKRHSMLRTRIDINGGHTPLSTDAEVAPAIALRIESRVGDDQWQSEAYQELNKPLPACRGPLMSVVLLKSDEVNDVILTLHHVMNDTASVLYLTRDLLGLLVQVMKGNRTPSLHIYPERRALDELPMCSAKIMDSLITSTALMVTQVTNTVQQRSRKPSKRIPAKPSLPKSSSPRRGDALHQTGCARMLHYVLSPEETALLNGQCKVESATIHGAICAAVLKAAGHHVCSSSVMHSAVVPVSCLSASRLQRALPVRSGDEIGLFIPIVTAAHYIAKQAKFWNIARHAGMTVQEAVKCEQRLVALSLPCEIAEHISDPGSGAVLVLNMGRLGLPNPYGSIVTADTRAPANSSGMADSFGVVINRLPNRLMLSFFYPESALSDDNVSLLGAAVVANLRTAISAD